jgi:hypothetical protein
VRQDRLDRGEAEGLTTQEQARLRQLEADNARLRMERDLLKRTVAFWVKGDAVMRYCCVDAQKGRRVPGSCCLPGGWGLGLGLLCLGGQANTGAVSSQAGRGRPGRRDPQHPH